MKDELRPPMTTERTLHWHDVTTMKPEDFGDAEKLPDDVKTIIRSMKPNRPLHISSTSSSKNSPR